MQRLFAYGTLMCSEIMGEVAGSVPSARSAVIRDYNRRSVRGECYPALVEEGGGRVTGVLYSGISDSAWHRLDRFEGNMYVRRLVTVELNDGSTTDAFTYVFRPEFSKMLSETAWDYATFKQRGLSRSRCHYSGHGSHPAGHRACRWQTGFEREAHLNNIQPFHLAIPVTDLQQARSFYAEIFGCEEGRSSDSWVDFNFFGHQLVIHHKPADEAGANERHYNPVDGHDVPVPHFGVVLNWEDWQRLAQRLRSANVKFVIEPYIRFEGQVGEQATMFLLDPSGNALEFKAFRDIQQLFAK